MDSPIHAQDALDYERMAQAIRYLDAHYTEQPSLGQLAEVVSMSPEHFQRMFSLWAGISPKRFLQQLSAQHLKARLWNYPTLADAAEAVGLADAARVHDLFVQLEALPPQVVRSGGRGLTLGYALGHTRFGLAVVAASPRGITDLHFLPDSAEPEAEALALLRQRWPHAHLVSNVEELPALLAGLGYRQPLAPLRLLVQGTQFQLKVWQALLHIPEGQVTSYSEVATTIGQPKALQAVGNAVGANPIGYLIPCHRVIRSTGVLSHYRWGPERKKLMLGCELAGGSGNQEIER